MKHIVLWSGPELGCFALIANIIYYYVLFYVFLFVVGLIFGAAVYTTLAIFIVGGAFLFIYLIARFLFLAPKLFTLQFPIFSYLLGASICLGASVCIFPNTEKTTVPYKIFFGLISSSKIVEQPTLAYHIGMIAWWLFYVGLGCTILEAAIKWRIELSQASSVVVHAGRSWVYERAISFWRFMNRPPGETLKLKSAGNRNRAE
jgi:hypothetical protein